MTHPVRLVSAVALLLLLVGCASQPTPSDAASSFIADLNALDRESLETKLPTLTDRQWPAIVTAIRRCHVDGSTAKLIDGESPETKLLIATAECKGAREILAIQMWTRIDDGGGGPFGGWMFDARNLPGGKDAQFSFPQIPAPLDKLSPLH